MEGYTLITVTELHSEFVGNIYVPTALVDRVLAEYKGRRGLQAFVHAGIQVVETVEELPWYGDDY